MRRGSEPIDISVLVPCYNEADSLPKTVSAIMTELAKLKGEYCELIIIDDGSSDNTKQVTKKIATRSGHASCEIIYLPLSRNFGKEAAVMAGYSEAKGSIVGCIDADGQHPPAELPVMITLLKNNPDVLAVVGVRSDQAHKKIGFLSSVFYRISRFLGNSHLIANGTDFRVMRRSVVDNFLRLKEHDRVNRELMDWLGFKSLTHEFRVAGRTAGKASYSTSKLIKLALNGLVSSGSKPLFIMLPFGALITLLSTIAILTGMADHLLLRDGLGLRISLQGYALMVVVLLFGIVFCLLGVLALYISKIFTEVQNRPHYVINQSEKL